MSRRMTWVVTAVLGLALAAVAVAQTPPRPGRGPMGPGMMMCGGSGMMAPGMMGHGMMGMGCPMMMPGVELKVAKLDDGVSITMTSSDPKVAARIQKRAEIMRLMHELQQEEP